MHVRSWISCKVSFFRFFFSVGIWFSILVGLVNWSHRSFIVNWHGIGQHPTRISMLKSHCRLTQKVGEVDELEEDVRRSISCFESVMHVKEGKLEEDLVDNQEPRSENRFTKTRCVVLDRWSIQKNLHVHRKVFRAIKLIVGVSSRTCQELIQFFFTYILASVCIWTSPLTVLIVVGLHDFVKVSISASLRSFLLIMCIDAPESTAESLASSGRFFRQRHTPIFRRWCECCFIFLLSLI